MSEMNSRESSPRYDEMTTDQLREILRKHAHGELEKEPDTEELFYIMEVLADKESTNPEKQIKSTEEAYETFVKHYAPEMAEEKPILFSRRGAIASRWMKRVAVFAIVFVALTTAAVSAKAFAPDFWEKVAIWTREIFRFDDVADVTEGLEPDKDNNVELDSLRDALGQHNVEEGLMPGWIPAGYLCESVNAKETPKERSISAIYKKEENHIVIKIRQVFNTKPQQIEKSDDLIEIYSVDGVDYYIFSNMDSIHIAWVNGEYECLVIGKISIDEAKKVIDSI